MKPEVIEAAKRIVAAIDGGRGSQFKLIDAETVARAVAALSQPQPGEAAGQLSEIVTRLCDTASKGEGIDPDGFRKLYERGDVIYVSEGDLMLLPMAITRHAAERDARVRELEAVAHLAASASSELKRMYDGADKEKRERGTVGSQHRDIFEAYLDGLVYDAEQVLGGSK